MDICDSIIRLLQKDSESFSLLEDLEHKWNMIGLDQQEKDDLISELNGEILKKCNEMLSSAWEDECQLKGKIQVYEAEKKQILTALGEECDLNSQVQVTSLKEALATMENEVVKLRERKSDRWKELKTLVHNINQLKKQFAKPGGDPPQLLFLNDNFISDGILKDLQVKLGALISQKNEVIGVECKRHYVINSDGSINELKTVVSWGVVSRDEVFEFVDGFSGKMSCNENCRNSVDAETVGLRAALLKALNIQNHTEDFDKKSVGFFQLYCDCLAVVRAFNSGKFNHYYGREKKGKKKACRVNIDLINQCRDVFNLRQWKSEECLETCCLKPVDVPFLQVHYIPRERNFVADHFSKLQLRVEKRLRYTSNNLDMEVEDLLIRDRGALYWRDRIRKNLVEQEDSFEKGCFFAHLLKKKEGKEGKEPEH